MTAVQEVRRNAGMILLGILIAALLGALILLPLTEAVVVLGTALAALALLRWPELALYLLVFAVPYGSLFPVSVGVGNLTAVDLLVVLVLALWLARMIVQTRAISIRWPPLAAPFALFLFAALVSTTVALSLQYSAKELAKWVEMFAIYVFVANEPEGPARSRLLAAIIVAGLSEAAIGIYQFLFQVGPEGFTLFGQYMRAYGTFEQPNPYAGYLGLIIPIAFGVVLGLLSQGWRREVEEVGVGAGSVSRGAVKWGSVFRGATLALFVAGALGVMLAALLMSWSRGAWLGVAAALVVVVMMQGRRAFIGSIAAASLLAIVILMSSLNIIPPAIADRFSGIGDYFGVFDVRGVKVDDANYAIVERMAHWQAAWEMFSDHPLLGVGFGNYAVVYPVYALPGWSDPLGHAHNYYLNVAAEAGLVGLTTYVLLWAAAFWQAWHAVRNSHGLERGLAAGVLGMLVALSVHNGFDDLFVHGMQVQVGVGLGIVGALWRAQAHSAQSRAIAPVRTAADGFCDAG